MSDAGRHFLIITRPTHYYHAEISLTSLPHFYFQQARNRHRNVEQTIENRDGEETEEGDEEEEEESMDGPADTGETGGDSTRRKRRKRKRRRREDGRQETGDSVTEQLDDEAEENRGERRRRGRRGREVKWQPQSYTFREKMHQLMEEELALPPYATDLVLRVI